MLEAPRSLVTALPAAVGVHQREDGVDLAPPLGLHGGGGLALRWEKVARALSATG